jgi:hypothetical protein
MQIVVTNRALRQLARDTCFVEDRVIELLVPKLVRNRVGRLRAW